MSNYAASFIFLAIFLSTSALAIWLVMKSGQKK